MRGRVIKTSEVYAFSETTTTLVNFHPLTCKQMLFAASLFFVKTSSLHAPKHLIHHRTAGHRLVFW